MDPKIIAQTMTANRNIQRLLKYLVLSHMIDNGVSQKEADEKLKRLLS